MADITITAANVLAGAGAETENGTLGATATAGQALYKAAADGRWYLADNNAASAEVRQAKGIALNGGAAGQPVRVLKSGLCTIGGTMTAGVTYYLSDTPGGICPIADVGSGEYSCIVGIATTTSILDVRFQYSGVAL
jgi:hypothetical protein